MIPPARSVSTRVLVPCMFQKEYRGVVGPSPPGSGNRTNSHAGVVHETIPATPKADSGRERRRPRPARGRPPARGLGLSVGRLPGRFRDLRSDDTEGQSGRTHAEPRNESVSISRAGSLRRNDWPALDCQRSTKRPGGCRMLPLVLTLLGTVDPISPRALQEALKSAPVGAEGE